MKTEAITTGVLATEILATGASVRIADRCANTPLPVTKWPPQDLASGRLIKRFLCLILPLVILFNRNAFFKPVDDHILLQRRLTLINEGDHG